MSNRIRITKPVVATRSQAEALLGEIATLTLQRNAMRIEMDEGITAIKDQFKDRLSQAEKALLEKTALIQAWAESNPEEFGERKSIAMVHGTIGFRTGTPKTKTLARKTWDAVKAAIIAFGRCDLIRTKEDVDKERIIADYQAGNITDAELRKFGMQVVQEEAFFVECDLQDLSQGAAR